MLQSIFGYRPRVQQQTAKQTSGVRIEQLNAADLNEKLQNGETPILLDVRSSQEYAYDGHIEGSRLIPLPNLMQRLSELPTDKPIVCVCRSGARSQAAAEQLVAQGFETVSNLSGGMIGWRGMGLPTK